LGGCTFTGTWWPKEFRPLGGFFPQQRAFDDVVGENGLILVLQSQVVEVATILKACLARTRLPSQATVRLLNSPAEFLVEAVEHGVALLGGAHRVEEVGDRGVTYLFQGFFFIAFEAGVDDLAPLAAGMMQNIEFHQCEVLAITCVFHLSCSVSHDDAVAEAAGDRLAD